MSLLTRHGYIIDYNDFTTEHTNELTVIADKGPYYSNDVQPFQVFEDRQTICKEELLQRLQPCEQVPC